MLDWDDFEYQDPALDREADEYEVSARRKLEEFFDKNTSDVFFGNQLAVQNEDTFFHWITYRAIADLVEAGLIHTERRKMAIGSEIKLVWHRKHRYYKRDASVLRQTDDNVCSLARARFTFSKMSVAFAVHTNALGSEL